MQRATLRELADAQAQTAHQLPVVFADALQAAAARAAQDSAALQAAATRAAQEGVALQAAALRAAEESAVLLGGLEARFAEAVAEIVGGGGGGAGGCSTGADLDMFGGSQLEDVFWTFGAGVGPGDSAEKQVTGQRNLGEELEAVSGSQVGSQVRVDPMPVDEEYRLRSECFMWHFFLLLLCFMWLSQVNSGRVVQGDACVCDSWKARG